MLAGMTPDADHMHQAQDNLYPDYEIFFLLIIFHGNKCITYTITNVARLIDRSVLNLLPFELAHIQVIVETLHREKFFMIALLNYFTLIDNQHIVRLADGA